MGRKPGRPRIWHDIRDSQRHRRLRYLFGIDLKDYEAMSARQGGVCAICGGVSKKSKRLCVDHRHSDKVIRGLLCFSCNIILGLAKDDAERLMAAAAYLTREGI